MIGKLLLGLLLCGLAWFVYKYLPQGKQILQNLATSLGLSYQKLFADAWAAIKSGVQKIIALIDKKPPAPPAPPAA